MYSTYLGGTGLDAGNAIAVDAAGAAYIAGQTYSSDLPVVNALQAASGGDYDAFVARLSAAGDAVLFLSYLGGNGSDTATSIALDSSANVYLAGWTLSTNFPVVNGYQSVNAGNLRRVRGQARERGSGAAGRSRSDARFRQRQFPDFRLSVLRFAGRRAPDQRFRPVQLQPQHGRRPAPSLTTGPPTPCRC